MQLKSFSAIPLIFLFFFSGLSCGNAQEKPNNSIAKAIVLGNERTMQYLPLLEGKGVGVVANHSSIIGQTHLVDSLISAGVDVKKVFSPEHGFRGNADAGEKVGNHIDQKTGLEIISLYGENKKPKPDQLAGIDVLIFDIQDVGARFYTYISTLHYVMEAAAENNIKVIVLDRPNPHGHYTDGPILDLKYKSFVGMHPVPIIHGMTIGEYAKMILGEKWLKEGIQCNLMVIECLNYAHSDYYKISIPPSPNLPNMNAIFLYPSLCLFEGTPISVGRGTKLPFQHFGHPSFHESSYLFTPKSLPGAKNPKYMNKNCLGTYLGDKWIGTNRPNQLDLSYLINSYNRFKDKGHFFTSFFSLLAGGKELEMAIINGKTEAQIRESWQMGLSHYKTIRKKYLLYPE